MGPEVIAAIIGAIASVVTTGAGLAVSAVEQNKANGENVNLANSQYTRAKADAIEAGFSPLVATGIQPSNVVVGSNSSNSSSLFGALSSSLNQSALGVGSQEHQSSENQKQREFEKEKFVAEFEHASSLEDKRIACQRYVAKLGADTETANTLSQIASQEKIKADEMASKLADGYGWLLTKNGKDYIRNSGELNTFLTKIGSSLDEYDRVKAYCSNPAHAMASRVKIAWDYICGRHPHVPGGSSGSW